MRSSRPGPSRRGRRRLGAGDAVPVALGVGGELALVAALGGEEGLRLLAGELVGEGDDAAVEGVAGAQGAAHAVGDAAGDFAGVVGALEGDESLQNVVVWAMAWRP